MFKLNLKLMACAALSAALLAGCGGGGGGGVGATVAPPSGMAQTITSVVEFIKNLIASNGENTDPIDLNALTLAVDDTAEPASTE